MTSLDLFVSPLGRVEGDLDVFDEDEPWEVIARAQAARRALHHALREE